MKLNFKRNANRIWVYLIIGVLSGILTIFLSSLLLPFHKKLLICKEMHLKNISGKQYVLYADLNSDGSTEKIILNRLTNYRPDPYIEILGEDGHTIVKKKLKESWIYDSWIIGDYNNDSLKEFYIFTRKRHSNLHDSLFIYGIDPFKEGKDFVNRIYITSFDKFFKQTIKNLPWSLKINIIGFGDSDSDGAKDLIFSIYGQKYLMPNNIFAFSPKKEKIVAQSPYFFNKYSFNIIKNDSNNFEIYPKYESTFQKSKVNKFYFFILNRKLEYEIKPFKLISLNNVSSINFSPILNKGSKYIGIFKIGRYKTKYINFKEDGNILGSSILNLERASNIKIINGNNKSSTRFFFRDKKKSLYILDSTLTPKIYFKSNGYFFLQYFFMNVDDDSLPELVANYYNQTSNKKYLYIYDDNLKDFAKLNILNNIDSRKIISTKYNKKNVYLSLSTKNFDALYLFKSNPYYHLNFVFAILGFLLLSFLLYYVFKQLNMMFFYYHFLARHLNTVNKGVLLLSFKGTVIHCNKNFVKMFNLPNVKSGQNVYQLFKPYPQITELLNKLLKGEKNEINEEITFQKPDKTFKGRLVGYFLSGIAGIPSGYYLEVYDMSESILSEREEVIARLIRKMAHDIKTPLSTIKFAVEAMHYILPDEEYHKVREDVSTVVQEVNHIHAITDNYAKFARLSKLNLEVISIKEIITKVINAHGYLDSVKVTVSIAPEAEMITADGTQIELLIKEVFENALDAVGREGEISFETYPVNLGNNEHSDGISLRISDNGVGIAKEIKDRIFEPNFSTKKQGSGFGLVLVKRIVLNHGGQITIDSEEGKGTHVLIILPKDVIEKKNETDEKNIWK